MTNVLVIDDDDEVRDFLVRLLKRRGYSVTGARNGEVGLASLETESFALVITDIVMPDMEGLETIKRMRRGNPALPIIAISGGGSSQIDYLNFARKFGANAVLAKPFDPAALLDLATQLVT
jgi:CheY-like chemotaxis protein